MPAASGVREGERKLEQLAVPDEAAGDSLVVAAWTLVSRLTGFLRVIVLGAVVGPTLFGNLYSVTNTLPNAVYYGLLAGSLVSSLLVPALVRWIDTDDLQACARITGGFLGALSLGLAAALPLFLVVTPQLLQLTSPVSGAQAAQAQTITRWLLVLLLPQVFLYALAGSSAAVMHARRRFGLAAAAPALENIGCIATLVIGALVYGDALGADDASVGQLLLLGGGTTASVGLHAALQWYGAWRCGVVVRPRAGWRDAEIVALIRRSLPAVAYSALGGVQLVAALLVTSKVIGGVIAFQIASNFFYLPIALGATPVALSLLPRLSRFAGVDDRLFRDALVRGLRLAFFVTLPASVVLAVLAPGLARAVAFGEMDSPRAHALIAAALTALALGIVAEAVFLIATYGAYARGDTRGPLRAMMLKTALCLGGLGLAFSADGTATLVLTGCALSLSTVVASVYQLRALLGVLPLSDERLASSAGRVLAAGAAMAVPLVVARGLLDGPGDHPSTWLGHLAALAAGGVVFVAVARLLRVAEVEWLRSAVAGKLGRVHADASTGAAGGRG